MSRFQTLIGGLVVMSALALLPAAAQAGGGCYVKTCTPYYATCYSPCYQTCSYPLYSYPQCYTPYVRTVVVQQPQVQTLSTPYVSSYGGCKVIVHHK